LFGQLATSLSGVVRGNKVKKLYMNHCSAVWTICVLSSQKKNYARIIGDRKNQQWGGGPRQVTRVNRKGINW